MQRERKVSFSVLLKLDSEEFQRQAQKLAKDFPAIESSVKLLINPAQMPTLKVALDKQVLGKELAEPIAKELSKAIADVKPGTNLLAPLKDIILAPFKSIATGAFEKIGQQLSTQIGAGIASQLEANVAPVIGSFNLLGRSLVKRAPEMGKAIQGILPEQPIRIAKVAMQEYFPGLFDKNNFDKIIADIRAVIGARELIIARELQLIAEANRQKQEFEAAQKSLSQKLIADLNQGEKRAKLAAVTEQRLAQNDKAQQKADLRIKEAEANLNKYRSEFAQEVNARYARLAEAKPPGSKSEEEALRQRAANAVFAERAERESGSVNPRTLSQQRIKEAQLAQEFESAKSELTSLKKEAIQLRRRLQNLRNPESKFTQELIDIGAKSPQIQTLREIKEAANEQRQNFIANRRIGQDEINRQMAPIQRLQELQSSAREKRARALSYYKTDVLFTETRDERKQLLLNLRRERKKYFRQIEAASKGIEKRLPRVRETTEAINEAIRAGQEDLNKALDVASRLYTRVQASLAQELSGIPQAPKVRPTPKIRGQEIQAPETFNRLIQRIFEISGVRGEIPKLRVDPELERPGSQIAAEYSAKKNTVFLRPQHAAKLASGDLDLESIMPIIHEVRHAIQSNFGKNPTGKGFNFLAPTPEESRILQKSIDTSVGAWKSEQERRGAINPDLLDAVTRMEEDAYTFTHRNAIQLLRELSPPSPKNIKLSEKQILLNKIREKRNQKHLQSLQEGNVAALEQLTKSQMGAIAKSAGIKGYSNKKVDELRQLLASSISAEDLSSLIPAFSSPAAKKLGDELAARPIADIRQESSQFLQDAKKKTILAGRAKDKGQLQQVLAEIESARQAYSVALAQDISAKARAYLQSAREKLGKQAIAASERIRNIEYIEFRQKSISSEDKGESKANIRENTKLSERQVLLNQIRKKQEAEAIASLQEGNVAALEQLTKSQMGAIAKSAGIKGYSNKKVDELRQLLASSISAEDLSFLIPTFSKVDADIKRTGTWFAGLATDEIRRQSNELLGYFRKTTATEGRAGNKKQLQQILDEIERTRKIFSTALAQDLSAESRNFLVAARARLGKQKIATQERIKNIEFKERQSRTQPQTQPQNQEVGNLFAANDPQILKDLLRRMGGKDANAYVRQINKNTQKQTSNASKLLQEMEGVARGEEKKVGTYVRQINKNTQKQTSNASKLLQEMEGVARGEEKKVGTYVRQINKNTQKQTSNASKLLQEMEGVARGEEKRQRQLLQSLQKSVQSRTNSAYTQAQKSLEIWEKEANRYISEVQQRLAAQAQQRQRKLQQRLLERGIDVDIAATAPIKAPERQIPVVRQVGRFLDSFQESRIREIRKQSQAIADQSSITLSDIDSQLSLSRNARRESKMLERQIRENEARLKRLFALRRRASGQQAQSYEEEMQSLASRIGSDRGRIRSLQEQIQSGDELIPYARKLRSASRRSAQISAKEDISGRDISLLQRYNQQAREVLELLGSPLPKNNFLSQLNLNIPPAIRNLLQLAQGFLAFQTIGMGIQYLKGFAHQALQTSIQFQTLNRALEFASGNSLDAAKNFNFIKKEIERLSIPVESSISAFTGLTAAARGTALEGEQARKVFAAVAQAASVYGLSAEQTEGALLALQQMVSKGTIQAEELRGQLGERLPGAFQVAARAMGVTTSELGKLLELGQITAEDFLPKFAKQLASETKEGVAGASQTTAAALQRLKNNWTLMTKALGDAIAPSAIAVFDTLGKGINFAVENAEVLKRLFITLAGTVTIAMVPAFVALGKVVASLGSVILPSLVLAVKGLIFANPVLLAGMAALTAGVLVAEDAAKALANALNGVSQEQIDLADRDVAFDAKYNKAIQQLLNQVPLADEAIKELNKNLDEQAARGVNSAKTTEILKKNLAKLQEQAVITAEAQRKLTQSVAENELAFKQASAALESRNLQEGLRVAQMRQAVGDYTHQDNEFKAAYDHNLRIILLYKEREKQIRDSLDESNRLQKIGRKGLDAKEELRLKEELVKIQNDTLRTQTEVTKQEYEEQERFRRRTLEDYEEQIKIHEAQARAGLLDQRRSHDLIMQIRQFHAEEEIGQIRQKRKLMLDTDREGLEALKYQEMEALARLVEARKNHYQSQFNLIENSANRARELIAALREQGKISGSQAAEKELEIATIRAQNQLNLIEQALKKIPKFDKERREELLVQQQKAMAEIAKARRDAYNTFLQDLANYRDSELAIAEGKLAQGLIQEEDYLEKRFIANNEFFDQQLSLISQRRQELNQNDIQGHRELDKAEAEIYKNRLENNRKFLEDRIRILDDAQLKAKQAFNQSVKDREIDIQRLINQNLLSAEESQYYLNDLKSQSIKDEIRLEEEKLNYINSLRGEDEATEKERLNRARDSRIKLSELTLELLKNEKSQQETYFNLLIKVYEKAASGINNIAQNIQQSFERQLTSLDNYNRLLENQSNLINAQKNLFSALSNYLDAEVAVLMEGTSDEEQRKQIAEATAAAKIRAAKIQNELEAKTLEIEIKQSELALKRLEIENKIAQIRNQAEIARQQLELGKISQDPNASAEAKEAARLQLQAAIAEGKALQEAAILLQEQKNTNNQINQLRQLAQQNEQSANIRRLQLEYAKSIASEEERIRMLANMRNESAMRIFGTSDFMTLIEAANRFNRNSNYATPLEAFYAERINAGLIPRLPQSSPTNPLPNTTQNPANDIISDFKGALDKFINSLNSSSIKGDISISAPITNNIQSPQPRQTAQDFASAFRKEMYNLGLELSRNR